MQSLNPPAIVRPYAVARRVIQGAALAITMSAALPVGYLPSFTSSLAYILPRPPFGIRAAQRAARKNRNRARNKRAHRGGARG